jgi:hypothetical protein
MSVSALCHAPLGAAASLDFGPAGLPGGLALPTGTCAGEGVLVGCRAAPGEPWSLLPLYTEAPGLPPPLPKGRFGRFLAAAGDKWMIGPLVFKVVTPFDGGAETDARFQYAPVVCGYIEYENTHSDTVAELVFALGRTGAPLGAPGLTGFMFEGAAGFATPAGAQASAVAGEAVFGTAAALSGLRFTVPPHQRGVFPLAIGFHRVGYHHATDFPDLAAVLRYGLQEHARFLALADRRDGEFMRSAADPATRTRVCEEVRRWLANSRRLRGEPAIDLTGLRELWRPIAG